MLKRLGLTVGVAVAILAVTGVLFSTVLAAGPGPTAGSGYGEPGEGTGPDQSHRYGLGDGTCDGTCDGTGPHGPTAGSGYGEPGDGTGPGLSHRYGAASQ